MKTSVEWLLEQLERNIMWTDKAEKIAEQAKEMHQKEMKDFAIELSKIDCTKTGTDILIDEAENLYNKIYKQPCL